LPSSIYELDVVVRMRDMYSNMLSGLTKNLGYTDAKLKLVQKSMGAFGSSSAEINKMSTALNKMARANQIGQLAADMQKSGAQISSIEAMASGFNKLADAQERIAAGRKLMMSGGLSIAAGIGLGALMIDPIKNAAELQKAMVQVKIATGASAAQMKQLTTNAMLGGLNTGLSSVMVSGVQKSMSQSGLPMPALMNPQVFSQYLKFSDLLYQRNGTPVEQSSAASVNMSHEYQLYQDPRKLAAFQNQLWKTLAVTHTGIQPMQNIFSYFAGTANRLGISASNSLSMESFLIRSGLAANGRSGGADIKNFLQRGASPASKAAAAAMEKYGLITGGHYVPQHYQSYIGPTGKTDHKLIKGEYVGGQSAFFQNGKFVGLSGMIDIMQNFSKQFHGNTPAELGAMKTIFGQQGGQFALAASGSSAPAMNTLLQKQIGAVPSINKSQAMQMSTLSGQLQRLKVGWQDVMTNLGMPQLSSATNFLTSVNAILKKIVKFQLAHPAMMKMSGDFVKLAAGALIFRGMIMGIGGAAKMLNGMFQLSKLFGDFTKLSGAAKFLIRDWGLFGGTMKIVGRSMMILGGWIGRITGLTKVYSAVQAVFNAIMDANPISLIIMAIGVLITVIVLVVTHWKTVVKWLKEAWTWFTHLGLKVQLLLAFMFPLIGIPALIIGRWGAISKFFSNLGDIISNLWVDFKQLLKSFANFNIPPWLEKIMGIYNWAHSAPNSTSPSAHNPVMSAHNGPQHITIHVHGTDPHTTAKHVVSLLGQHGFNTNSGSPYGPNKIAFGH